MSNLGILTGGWYVEVAVGSLPEKVATGFGEVFQEIVGAQYTPLVYCGSQVVCGTNYMIICEQTLTTNPPEKHVVKVVIHESLPEEGQIMGEFSLLYVETIV